MSRFHPYPRRVNRQDDDEEDFPDPARKIDKWHGPLEIFVHLIFILIYYTLWFIGLPILQYVSIMARRYPF